MGSGSGFIFIILLKKVIEGLESNLKWVFCFIYIRSGRYADSESAGAALILTG